MFGMGRGRGRHTGAEDPVSVEDGGPAEHPETADRGPYDAGEAPADGVERLDLGSVQVPVPEGAQLQVEIDQAGPVRNVHLITPVGRLTVSAFAAPKTSGLWREVSRELLEQLREDGAKVHIEEGEWGSELVADSPKAVLRFVGVDGPRWMVRGVAAGPAEQADECTKLLYAMLDSTVVVRGDEPLPVRTPLPIQLPEAIAKHIEQAQAEEQPQA